jgi:hypothetical protein
MNVLLALLIGWLLTPGPDLPLQAHGLSFIVSPALYLPGPDERAVVGLTKDELSLHLVTQNEIVPRLETLFNRHRDAIWWTVGRRRSDNFWLFSARLADTITAQTVEDNLRNEAPDATITLPQPLVTLGNSCFMQHWGDDDLGIYSLLETAVNFRNGEGWRAVHYCITNRVGYGDGAECGGVERAYVPVVWYAYYGHSADGSILLTANVPLRLDLPELRGSVTFCTFTDGTEAVLFHPEEWAASGWLPYDGSAYAPSLSDEALARYAAQVRAAIARQAADHVGALDVTFATITLDAAWVAEALDQAR